MPLKTLTNNSESRVQHSRVLHGAICSFDRKIDVSDIRLIGVVKVATVARFARFARVV